MDNWVTSSSVLPWLYLSMVPCSLYAFCALDKESGERLSRLVEEACMLLADYSGRLAAEIDDRRQLTRTLTVFLQSQKDGLAQNEQKLEVRESLFFFQLPFVYLCVLSTSPLCHNDLFLVFICLHDCMLTLWNNISSHVFQHVAYFLRVPVFI